MVASYLSEFNDTVPIYSISLLYGGMPSPVTDNASKVKTLPETWKGRWVRKSGTICGDVDLQPSGVLMLEDKGSSAFSVASHC